MQRFDEQDRHFKWHTISLHHQPLACASAPLYYVRMIFRMKSCGEKEGFGARGFTPAALCPPGTAARAALQHAVECAFLIDRSCRVETDASYRKQKVEATSTRHFLRGPA